MSRHVSIEEVKKRDEQFSRVFSCEEQGEGLRCVFQPLDDVVFADDPVLRDPFTEYLQGFGISRGVVVSTTRSVELKKKHTLHYTYTINPSIFARCVKRLK